MKRVIATISLVLLLLVGCNSQVPEPAECALCDAFPRHAPCLVNLNTGELYELVIYQPHHTKVAELSEEQRGGYMSLVHFGDISGILLGADRVELKSPEKLTGIQNGLFCNNCRKLLKENNCKGYVFADLRTPETPTVWKIADGVSFSVRCYDVQISQGDETGKLKILMTGTLETNDSTRENADDVLP